MAAGLNGSFAIAAFGASMQARIWGPTTTSRSRTGFASEIGIAAEECCAQPSASALCCLQACAQVAGFALEAQDLLDLPEPGYRVIDAIATALQTLELRFSAAPDAIDFIRGIELIGGDGDPRRRQHSQDAQHLAGLGFSDPNWSRLA